MNTYIIVEYQKCRCGKCKTALPNCHDKKCNMCNRTFTGIVSNIVGEAEKLKESRMDDLPVLKILEHPIEMVGS